ncbi:MAG: hypothetical protein SGPRY_007546 [Prymnesium sp.]
MDAARENGSGYGGFLVVAEAGVQKPRFLFMAETWDQVALAQLQSDVLSMPAGECFEAVMLADAVARRLKGLSHLWYLTDSVATRSAITTGNSGAPQLDFLVTWLCQRQPGVQFIAVHGKGVRNVVADRLSRGGAAGVLSEVQEAGLLCERLFPDPEAVSVIRHTASLDHKRRA